MLYVFAKLLSQSFTLTDIPHMTHDTIWFQLHFMLCIKTINYFSCVSSQLLSNCRDFVILL